jgi:glyoxylase-like metal-dependent hydrolase (beta-lactamase superfamily II)
VLVDTGADGLAPSTGRLIQNLKSVGIAPEHIDTVIITHGHPDHIGGNTDDKGRPAFPNARYVMWQDEWEFWTSGQVLFSSELLWRFKPKKVISVAPCTKDDNILKPLLERHSIQVVIITSD